MHKISQVQILKGMSWDNELQEFIVLQIVLRLVFFQSASLFIFIQQLNAVVNKEGGSLLINIAVAQNGEILLLARSFLAQKVLRQGSVVDDCMLVLLNFDGGLGFLDAETLLFLHILVDSKMVLLELLLQRSDVFEDALTEVVEIAFHLDHARVGFLDFDHVVGFSESPKRLKTSRIWKSDPLTCQIIVH